MAEARSYDGMKLVNLEKKRRAYKNAQKAYRKALEAAKALRGRDDVSLEAVDEQEREIRMMIVECHKSGSL